MSRVGLDIDDVLADFIGAYCTRYNLKRPSTWEFDPLFGERYYELCQDIDFWLNLTPLCDPKKLSFTPVCYITARKCPRELTILWLLQNGFPNVPVYHSHLWGGSKSRVAKANKLDLFIDDCYDNYKKIKDSGIPCKLYTCSHNLQYDVGSDRIKNMEKI